MDNQMTNQQMGHGGEQSQAAAINDPSLERYLQEVRDNQNLVSGLVGGAGAALLGAVIWAAVTVMTGYQIGWMAVGVGFLAGYGVRKFGQGVDTIFGVVGAVIRSASQMSQPRAMSMP